MSGVSWDVIVIGGGIAGIGAAARIAADARVLVLERELAIGYHTTGRSAAILIDGYGNRVIRALTAAGRSGLSDPDPEFWPEPLLGARGELQLARPGEEALVEAHAADNPGITVLSPAEAVGMVPILDRAAVALAGYDPAAQDIDVDRLVQGFRRMLLKRGGAIRTGADIRAIECSAGVWRITLAQGDVVAPVVVNAAGAWGDAVAALAGVAPVGLQPKRRSAVMVPLPEGVDPNGWPLFGGVREDWYAKPTGGQLMVSPADEDPVEPHDAWPDDMVLAEGLERYGRMVTLPVTRIGRSWAGLRSFVADRSPVAGFDPQHDGFFWLVGQGGYGIQTAPGLSAFAADLIAGRAPAVPADIVAGLSPARLHPT